MEVTSSPKETVENALVQLARDYAISEAQNVKEPKIGMVFGSPDEAFQFYKEYSCKIGFGITRRSSHNYYGIKYDVTFSCNKNRKPVNNEEQEGFGSRARGVVGTGCKAHIKLKDPQLRGSWTIEEVVLEHNHELSPNSVRLMRCHREIPLFVKKQLEINEMAGLAQSKSISAIFTQVGGITKCSFSERDMRNYVSEIRRLNLRDGDAAALMSYFHQQQANSSNFFYSCDVDDDGRLRNVFWADARSRSAYKYFSDVVTFDTTYLTNRYRMPFAVFVGVNHHGQSILLGCALLSNEFTDSFVWLFRTLLTCMRGEAPKAIITDQCGAICSALSEVLPNTRHRLCLWHILKKLPEKLAGVSDREKIIDSVCNMVYDSASEDEFESKWVDFMGTVELGKNKDWFSNLYDIRQKWIPAFVKNSFWAGMSTTQRSESMNAFFDGYINSRTSLKSFVEKYNSALHFKWEKESQEDWRCKDLKPKLISTLGFEVQFSEIYTLKQFYKFQGEIKLLMTCFCEQVADSDTHQSFLVSELSGQRRYTVTYTTDTQEYSCECMMFEFRGIVCRHGLCVYRQLRVDRIPGKYVLSRWRKDYVRSHIQEVVPEQVIYRDIKSYNEMYAAANQNVQELIEIATTDPDLHGVLIEGLNMLKQKLLAMMTKTDAQVSMTNPPEDSPPCGANATIKDPLVVRSKGRPRKNRIQGGVEKSKKARKSGVKECRGKGTRNSTKQRTIKLNVSVPVDRDNSTPSRSAGIEPTRLDSSVAQATSLETNGTTEIQYSIVSSVDSN